MALNPSKSAHFQSICPFELGYLDIIASATHILSVGYSKDKPASQAVSSPLTDRAKTQLQQYFQGNSTTFDLPLDLTPYTPFQQAVWNQLLTIPYGKTSSYSALANKLNNPKAVRAVGTANGRNPFTIVIPCHRIIGKDNSMTGYASGIAMKRWLLELEGALVKEKTLFD